MGKCLSHLDDEGRPLMVDISQKDVTARLASAVGRVVFSQASYLTIKEQGVEKGSILRIAEIAGIIGAKRTSDLIPLCHPLAITSISVKAEFDDRDRSVRIESTIKTTGKTGVEMEALTAVSIACLTVYDMAKAVDKSMSIGPICLTRKSGGATGDFQL